MEQEQLIAEAFDVIVDALDTLSDRPRQLELLRRKKAELLRRRHPHDEALSDALRLLRLDILDELAK
jgi:hypothetical protein